MLCDPIQQVTLHSSEIGFAFVIGHIPILLPTSSVRSLKLHLENCR